MIHRYSNHLEVWKLGSYATTDSGDVLVTNVNATQDANQSDTTNLEQDSTIDIINKAKAQNTQKQSLRLTEKPVKLVAIQTKGKKQLRCCALSPNGELVVYSTATDVRMLKLDAVSVY